MFVEVGISGLQTFHISEKGAAIKRVLFEHLFLCDHYQRCIYSVVFIKESCTAYVFSGCFLKFVAAISKYSHEKICDGVWQCSKTFSPCILIKNQFQKGQFVEIVGDKITLKKSPVDTYPGSNKQNF